MQEHTAGIPWVSHTSITAVSVRTRMCRSRMAPPSSRTTRQPVTSRPALLPRERTSIVSGITTIQVRASTETWAMAAANDMPGYRCAWAADQVARVRTAPAAYRP